MRLQGCVDDGLPVGFARDVVLQNWARLPIRGPPLAVLGVHVGEVEEGPLLREMGPLRRPCLMRPP